MGTTRLRGSTPFDAQPATVEAIFVTVLLKVAEAGVDDGTAGVFLRCWASETGEPLEVATALSQASHGLRGVANTASLVVVDRWIDGLAPVSLRSRFRRYLLGHI